MPGKAAIAPQPFEEAVAGLIAQYEARSEEIGRILHDDLGQVLSGAGFQLEALKLDLKGRPALVRRVVELQGTLELAMTRARRLSTELNPSVVERAGLHYALKELALDCAARKKATVEFDLDEGIRVPRAAARAFYRVGEYAMARAEALGSCSLVRIRLRAKGKGAELEIRYDATDGPRDSAGRLEAMKVQYHARQAGLFFAIRSRGRSTIVSTSYSEGTRGVGTGSL